MNRIQVYDHKKVMEELSGLEGEQEMRDLLSLKCLEFSKVYNKSECIVGALMIDLEVCREGEQQVVPYYLSKEKFFLAAEGEKRADIQKLLDKTEIGENVTSEQLFCALLEAVLTNDLEDMQRMEAGCYKLEENLLGTLSDYVGPTKKILRYRKQLLAKEFYYQQIADLCDVLYGNKNDFFSPKALDLIEDIGKRADRLCGYVQTLREYLMQIWELYEQQVDVQQNKTMRILTVVTTIFLPLTLMAGWYGMNFEYMPELKSPWGYWITMGVAAFIAIGEIIFFKKKKYF